MPIDHVHIAGEIKAGIKTVNKYYPKQNLEPECKYLDLTEFLAPYKATGTHWTHKTLSLL